MSEKNSSTKSTFEFDGKSIPNNPGCYLFYEEIKPKKSKKTDEENSDNLKNQENQDSDNFRLLYIGKAKNLRKRVSQYFQKNKKSPKTSLMVSKIAKIETRIVRSEMEALILENNLIKELKPRFNILMRDDKNFLYLRITKEDFPRLEITRRMVRDGSFYFGPKTSAKSFRKTINFCQKVFQIRTCKLDIAVGASLLDAQKQNAEKRQAQGLPLPKPEILKNPENKKIPCLDFHIKKCSGPCSGDISREDYQNQVNLMKQFLRGKNNDVLKNLQEKMMGFAQNKNFEAAAKIRDLIQSIEISTQKQTVQFLDGIDRDFIQMYQKDRKAFIVRLSFREGKFTGQDEVSMSIPPDEEVSKILSKFIEQFYPKVDILPHEILLPELPEFPEILEELLQKNHQVSHKVHFIVPQKGDKAKALEIAQKNAENFAKKSAIEDLSQTENFAKALPKLAEHLNLKSPPQRMECYDISHFSGEFPVASQVVFLDGKPAKNEYRRYHIKNLPDKKIDDFASMHEVLTRRFNHLKNPVGAIHELPLQEKNSHKIPDLIVIDGGKGQLSAVRKIFTEEFQIEGFNPDTQIISLAKKEEQIFRPGNSAPIELDWNDPALKLLQRIRDEAHRFAITFNRNLRQKNQTKSILDEVPGIGTATKKKLMQKFETVSGIREASDEELLRIIGKKQLENLHKFL